METLDDLRYMKLPLVDGSLIPALGFRILIPDPTDTENAVLAALEVRFPRFDGAERYRNENAIGEANGGEPTFWARLRHVMPSFCVIVSDEVIDYTKDRFENEARDVDVVLDTVGGNTLERSWGGSCHGGVPVTLAGTVSEEKAAARGVRGVSFIIELDRTQLVETARLIDSWLVRPVVLSVLPLE